MREGQSGLSDITLAILIEALNIIKYSSRFKHSLSANGRIIIVNTIWNQNGQANQWAKGGARVLGGRGAAPRRGEAPTTEGEFPAAR